MIKEYYSQASDIWSNYDIIYRPVDRRENYVKRCVGLPGDIISVKGGVLYVNDKAVPDNGKQQPDQLLGNNKQDQDKSQDFPEA
ncbi:MAG: S26 family signal peptidase [Bacteroidales bacterium]